MVEPLPPEVFKKLLDIALVGQQVVMSQRFALTTSKTFSKLLIPLIK